MSLLDPIFKIVGTRQWHFRREMICSCIVDVLNKLASARIYWSIDLAEYEVDPTRIAMKRENAKQIQVILS